MLIIGWYKVLTQSGKQWVQSLPAVALDFAMMDNSCTASHGSQSSSELKIQTIVEQFNKMLLAIVRTIVKI